MQKLTKKGNKIKNLIAILCLCAAVQASAATVKCFTTHQIIGDPARGQIQKLDTAFAPSTITVNQLTSDRLDVEASTEFGFFTCAVTRVGQAGPRAMVGTGSNCTLASGNGETMLHIKPSAGDDIGVMISDCK